MESFLPCGLCLFTALILLVIANGMPVMLRNMFGKRFSKPIDCGVLFIDKRPLFGQSKTWRGLVAAILFTSLSAPVFGLTLYTGALFGTLAILGDLSASFIKRRLGYSESSRCRILDTLPESLLPLLLLRDDLQLSVFGGILTVALFFIFEVLISPVLFRLHIRKRPY